MVGALAIGVIWTLPLSAMVEADSSLPTTDVVLAIDQSGSTAQSDPLNQRIEAAKQFVETSALFTDSYPVRLGAVYFGSPQFPNSVQLIQPLVTVTSPNLTSLFHPESVPGTDFDAALCLAWSTVTGQPAAGGCQLQPGTNIQSPPAGTVRSRSIILVTDGFPAPNGADLTFSPNDGPTSCPDGSSGHVYMCRLVDRWHALTARVPVSLYVIGIDRDNVWFPRTEAYWKAVTGCQGDISCSKAVRRAADPAKLASDVLNAGTGSLVDLCARTAGVNDCDLPASLSEVQFVVRGVQGTDTVQIKDPQGVLMGSVGPRVQVVSTEGVQRWRIRAPAKGNWLVQSSTSNAQLSVVKVMVPQRFVMQTVPDQPELGDSVSFELRADGDLIVDLPSLMSASLILRLQSINSANGGFTSQQSEQLIEMSPGVLRTTSPIAHIGSGRWAAALLMDVGGETLQIGQDDFSVGDKSPTPVSQPATSTATSIPTLTATPDNTPTLVATATVTSTSTSTVPPVPTATSTPVCHIAFQPTGTEVSRYQAKLTVGYPLSFSKNQDFSSQLVGPGCNSHTMSLEMQLAPVGGTAVGCVPAARCDLQATPQENPELHGKLDGGALQAKSLRRNATAAEIGGAWTLHTSDEVNLVTPAWVLLEQRSFIDYWLLPLLVLAVLYAVSFASTFQTVVVPGASGNTSTALRRVAVYFNARTWPIVRLGGIVWRPFQDADRRDKVVMLRYVVAGSPIVRSLMPATPKRNQAGSGGFSEWASRARTMYSGVALATIARMLTVRGRR